MKVYMMYIKKHRSIAIGEAPPSVKMSQGFAFSNDTKSCGITKNKYPELYEYLIRNYQPNRLKDGEYIEVEL